MLSEPQRIGQLLERTYAGDAWHGPSVRQTLADLSTARAVQRLNDSHNVAELVRHMTAWRNFVINRLEGNTSYELSEEDNWSTINHLSQPRWEQLRVALDQSQQQLLRLLEDLEEARLYQPVARRSYDYYVLLHGIIQHDVYHTGQIQLLSKKA